MRLRLGCYRNRPHFRSQLSQKLLSRGFDLDEIEKTLQRLEQWKYLDEDEAVRLFVEQKRRRLGWGISRLRAELSRRGADSAATTRVLDTIDEASEEDLARVEVEKWRRRGAGDPNRLARRLARKGIPTRVIVLLLNEVRGRGESLDSDLGESTDSDD